MFSRIVPYAHREWGSDTNSSGPTSGDLQLVGVDVDDLWLPFQSVGRGFLTWFSSNRIRPSILFSLEPSELNDQNHQSPADRPFQGKPRRQCDIGIEGGQLKKVALDSIPPRWRPHSRRHMMPGPPAVADQRLFPLAVGWNPPTWFWTPDAVAGSPNGQHQDGPEAQIRTTNPVPAARVRHRSGGRPIDCELSPWTAAEPGHRCGPRRVAAGCRELSGWCRLFQSPKDAAACQHRDGSELGWANETPVAYDRITSDMDASGCLGFSPHRKTTVEDGDSGRPRGWSADNLRRHLQRAAGFRSRRPGTGRTIKAPGSVAEGLQQLLADLAVVRQRVATLRKLLGRQAEPSRLADDLVVLERAVEAIRITGETGPFDCVAGSR